MLYEQCRQDGHGVGGKAVKLTGFWRSGRGPRGPDMFYMFLYFSVVS